MKDLVRVKIMDVKSCNGSVASGPTQSKSEPSSPVIDDTAELRRELVVLRRALRLQTGALTRQQRRSAELELKLQTRDTTEKTARAEARDREATTLLRALLVLEASLLREKSLITQKLKAKDARLQMQEEQIQRLKQECSTRNYCRNCQQLMGFTSEQTNIETDPEFHSLESVDSHKKFFERSLSYHEKQIQQPFQKNSRLSKSFQFPKVNNDHNTSSSEEVFEGSEQAQGKGNYVKNKQAFVRKDVTRRSRKFSGRKHSSAYLDAVQKRQSRSQGSSSSAEDGPQSEKDLKFNLEGEECDIGEEITKDIERASNRIDELLNGTNSNVETRQFDLLGDRNTSISEKMNGLHGIKKSVSLHDSGAKSFNGDVERPWYTNSSDQELEGDGLGDKLGHRSMSADDILSASSCKNNVSPANNKSIETERSKSSISLNDKSRNEANMHSIIKRNSDLTSEKSNYETRSVKFDNEPSENWYASASDPDDDPSCEIYKNNPVLECVNQILLQNSLDENSVDGSRTYEAVSPKASMKRVQFSTLNSISFDESVGKNNHEAATLPRLSDRRSCNKIVKFSLETASEHSYEVPVTSEGFNYEIQSIYSNDYEPIITKKTDSKDYKIHNERLTPVPLPRLINAGSCTTNSAKNVSPKKMSIVKNMALNLESKINNNHYVDMDTKYVAKSGVANKKKVPRVPPALPPKPKNLVSKFKLNAAASNGGSSNPNSDPVVLNQRSNDVHVKAKQSPSKAAAASEPDYCSISEINVPVVSSGKRGLILSQASVEIHAEKFSPNIAERRAAVVPKLATISKIVPNKINDKDIPKLPQVTEIIIPDEEDVKEKAVQRENAYMTPIQTSPLNSSSIMDLRSSIQMGHSVSKILTNRNFSLEDVSKVSPEHTNKKFQSAHKTTNLISPNRNKIKMADKTRLDLAIFEAAENDSEKFDLSQNFEEFKIDDCEFTNMAAEEYRISSGSDGSGESVVDDSNNNGSNLNEALHLRQPSEGLYKIEFTAEDELSPKVKTDDSISKTSVNHYSKMSNKPDLLSNIDSIETDSVRYSDLESSNSSSSNCGSYNTVKEVSAQQKVEPKHVVAFEYFLESSGLSSKSILTPSRPPNANHKNVLKPKDIKMRSKNGSGVGKSMYEKCGNTAIKYFEPYL